MLEWANKRPHTAVYGMPLLATPLSAMPTLQSAARQYLTLLQSWLKFLNESLAALTKLRPCVGVTDMGLKNHLFINAQI